MQSWTKEQIEAANLAYHKAEAGLYDDLHPEIISHETRRWNDFFKRWDAERKGPTLIVEVGAGTGFVFNVAKNYLTADDIYIATDLTPDMLAICQKKSDIGLRTIVAPADRVPLENGTADLVLMNSVLHHLPDPKSFTTEAYRLLKPNGTLVVMHEPNIAFAKSWFMKKVALIASYGAYHLRKKSNVACVVHDKKSEIYKKVNAHLLENGLIDHELTDSQIQTMVDVHSPTASGHYEEVGFDPDFFLKPPGWKLASYLTYNFLGKTDPSASVWHRMANGLIKIFSPNNGAFFAIELRKN